MKRIVHLTIILQLVCFLAVLSIHGQSNNDISGTVYDPERQPVVEIYVELLNEMNGIIGRKKTNSGGRYLFNGVSGGTFTIRVLTQGTDLEEESEQVNISTSGIAGSAPSESIMQDFHLKRRKNADGSPAFTQNVPEEPKKLYGKAVDSLVGKKQDEGIQLLEQAIGLFPDYFYALQRLGQEYGSLEKWEESYNFFKKATIVNQGSFTSWYGLSIAAGKLKKVDEALEAAQKATQKDPSSFEGQLLLGNSLRRVQKFEDAEKAFIEADKLAKGKSADVHWNIALLYAHNLKKYAEAANHLEQYLKIKPNDPQADNVKKLIKQFREKAAAGG